MSNIFFNFKNFIKSNESFMRGVISVIDLFPKDHVDKPLAKKYIFQNYRTDELSMYNDWKKVGDDIKNTFKKNHNIIVAKHSIKSK